MKNTKLVVIFFLFHLCGHVYLLSQNPRLFFHQLTIKEGLSENSVRHIIEDPRGFMWFGTSDGVNRYDGYNFRVYKKNNNEPYSISYGDIKDFFIDSKGNLWVGTRNGINLYDHLHDRFYNFHSKDYPALRGVDGDIESIEEDEEGNIWVSAGVDGVYRLSSSLKN